MRKSLTKSERVKKAQFKAIFLNSKKVKGQFSKLVYKENLLSINRFAVSIGKKSGNAVKRNYIKRIIREIYRLDKDKIKPGYDFIWVIYPVDGNYEKYKREFFYLIKKSFLAIEK